VEEEEEEGWGRGCRERLSTMLQHYNNMCYNIITTCVTTL
jgi:hypothetical protein